MNSIPVCITYYYMILFFVDMFKQSLFLYAAYYKDYFAWCSSFDVHESLRASMLQKLL